MPSPATCCATSTAPDAQAGGAARAARPHARRFLALVRRSWRSYWEWRARRATVMILASLDDRTLRDIGISPGEIASLVQCSNDRRRRYDAGWMWRGGG